MTNLTESKPTRLEIRPSIVTWNERERITSPDRSWIWIAAFTVLYFPLTILRAAARPMWFDELFTFYISRMSLGNIWTILSSGIEPNPPLSYWLTHFSMGLFGQNEIAVRLPAIAGYWLMSICLFFFVRRYGSDVCAAVAMVFPLCTEAYLPYAAEGRGYGLVLGFSGLACLCWQYACSHRSRNLAVIGLWLSLVGALVSHYYSVLMLIPFGVAEVVRWWRSRRLDLPVAAAIVGSLLPLAILYPALKRGSAFITQLVRASSNFWAMPSASKAAGFYREFLDGALPSLVLALIAIVLLEALWSSKPPASEPSRLRLPLHEIALAVSIATLPAFAMILGKVFTGSFIYRYAICTVIGCSMLIGIASTLAGQGRPRVPIVLVAAFFAWFMANDLHKPNSVPKESVPEAAMMDDKSPIVISSPLEFLKLFHYAPPAVASRLYYLTDLNTASKMPDFVPEMALNALKGWFHIPVKDYATFVASHRSFTVCYSSTPKLEWLPSRLAADGYDVRLKSQSEDTQVFEVVTRTGF